MRDIDLFIHHVVPDLEYGGIVIRESFETVVLIDQGKKGLFFIRELQYYPGRSAPDLSSNRG